jgi:hypothetical protein
VSPVYGHRAEEDISPIRGFQTGHAFATMIQKGLDFRCQWLLAARDRAMITGADQPSSARVPASVMR